MEPNSIRIVLATEEHLLSGNVVAQNQRLFDILEDLSTDFLRLADVQVFRRGGGTCVAKTPDAIVRKASVGFAALAGEEHEAPEKRIRTYVAKKRFETLMLIMGYEIKGTLHLKGAGDSVTTLCHELGSFFPVAQATLSFAGLQVGQQRAQVIIANKAFVSLFRVAEMAADEPPTPRRPGSDA